VLSFLRRHALGFILGACIAVTVVPLWAVRHLPAVDVPQHLFLIHVLGHLSIYPYRDIYVAQPG
jgi:hypothetical protein